jgi:hypothetical protein
VVQRIPRGRVFQQAWIQKRDPANGTAERDAAAEMLADAAQIAGASITVGADKNYDTAGFVATCFLPLCGTSYR